MFVDTHGPHVLGHQFLVAVRLCHVDDKSIIPALVGQFPPLSLLRVINRASDIVESCTLREIVLVV